MGNFEETTNNTGTRGVNGKYGWEIQIRKVRCEKEGAKEGNVVYNKKNMDTKKPILISGIQPSGALHIGNYLGALKNFVGLQNSGKYRCYFFVADLHSLTEDYEPKEKPKQVLDLALSYLAAGIDPKKSTIFVQSAIPAHAELTWILNIITPLGELRRMTQFKEKSKTGAESANVGLFDYPVLMAADILLYGAKYVPVGEDQLQHLELTRTLARKFNAKFPARAGGGKTFVEPQSLLTKVPRLMSLDDPTKKMSKSRPAGCLFLDDSPAAIREKLARATTDSGKEVRYAPDTKPGISNLLKIHEALSSEALQLTVARYKNKGYAEFKRDLAETVIKALAPFQAKKKTLKAPAFACLPAEALAQAGLRTGRQNSKLKAILAAGNKKANAVAEKKLAEVKERVGLF